jgi:hypothetical protein
MNKNWPWIIVIFVGIAGVFTISWLNLPKVPQKNYTAANESTGSQNQSTNTNTETPASEPTAENSNQLPEGWQKIETSDFAISLPQTWIIKSQAKYQPTGDNFSPEYFLASGQPEGVYGDPDVIEINISQILKANRSTEEITQIFGKKETDIATTIKFMQENAIPPYNELTTNDIKFSQYTINLNNGTNISKITFQCLKTCYIEGPATTIVQYFIETPEKILKLEAKTPTSEKTETLLLMAEQVVKTMEIK